MATPKEKFPDFDESLLEANLELTVEERLIAHDAALEVALEFQRAGEELYGQHDEPSSMRSSSK